MSGGRRVGKADSSPEPVTKGSGNVFADLAVPRPGLALAKANLALRVCDAIRTRDLTRAAAASLLKLTPLKLSDLMRGKLESFSLDRLVTLLNRLGLEVEFAVRPRINGRTA